jgi:hypothetical protein
MPGALVQRSSAGTTANTSGGWSAVFASAPTQGNTLVAYLVSNFTGSMTSTGWTSRASLVNNVQSTTYQKVAGAGESSTVTWTPGGAANTVLIIEEWSGLTATPFDQAATGAGAAGSATTVPTGTTAATAQADELAVAAAARIANPASRTVTGWSNSFASTLDVTSSGATVATENTRLTAATVALAATGTQTTTATLSGTSDLPQGMIMTLKASAAVAATPGRMMAPPIPATPPYYSYN